MKTLLVSFFIAVNAFAFSPCDDLYRERGKSVSTVSQALNCYNDIRTGSAIERSQALNKISHLRFFLATYYKQDSIANLEKAMEAAENSIKQYGQMFEVSATRGMDNASQEELALSYYMYGTALSKYVDLKGRLTAILRMGDIKNSMKIILRMRKEHVFYYGALRNLAIFNLKVPAIAGGSMRKAKVYFERLMQKSVLRDGLSSYLVNHIFYAEYLKKDGQKQKACAELLKVASLNRDDVERDYADLYYESLADIKNAKQTARELGCSR